MIREIKKSDINISLQEFWMMPLSMVLEVMGVYTSPSKKPISRKSLIDHERKMNMARGI